MNGHLPTPIEEMLKVGNRVLQETPGEVKPKIKPGQNPWLPFIVTGVAILGSAALAAYLWKKKADKDLKNYSYARR